MASSSGPPTTPDRISGKEESIQVQEPHKFPLYNAHVDVSEVDERKLLRKIDLALIPWLSLLYLLSFLDRTSIGKYVSDPHFLPIKLAEYLQQCKGMLQQRNGAHSFTPALHSFTTWRHHYT